MLQPVLKHVNDPEANLARRLERPSVVPPVENLSLATNRAIDGARYPNLEARRAASEPNLVRSLDHQMNVISLHGEVEDPEAATRCLRDAVSNLYEHDLTPKTGQTVSYAKGDVGGVAKVVGRSRAMRDVLAM